MQHLYVVLAVSSTMPGQCIVYLLSLLHYNAHQYQVSLCRCFATTELVYISINRRKNRRGHWVCWMSKSRKNGLMRTTHTHHIPGTRYSWSRCSTHTKIRTKSHDYSRRKRTGGDGGERPRTTPTAVPVTTGYAERHWRVNLLPVELYTTTLYQVYERT